MSWKVTIPGQAMSVNHIYINTLRRAHNGRQYQARKLSNDAQAYFDAAVYLMRAAKPSNWAPEGQVRVVFDLYLTRDLDCDNAMKLVSDALEAATGINDARFLHCTRSKTTRLPSSQARIELEIVDPSESLLLPPVLSEAPPKLSSRSSAIYLGPVGSSSDAVSRQNRDFSS